MQKETFLGIARSCSTVEVRKGANLSIYGELNAIIGIRLYVLSIFCSKPHSWRKVQETG